MSATERQTKMVLFQF